MHANLAPPLDLFSAALSQLWLFWVAPIVGGMIGAVVYKAVVGDRD